MTYTGDERTIEHTRYYLWFHPISDIINALIRAGLTIDFFNEHEILTWKALPDMIPIGDNQFKLAPHHPRVAAGFFDRRKQTDRDPPRAIDPRRRCSLIP